MSAPPTPVAQITDVRKVEQSFQQLVRVDPNNANVYFVLGMIAHRDGRHETAIEYVGRAIALEPLNADFHHGLGLACGAVGRFETATTAYQEALRLRPDYALAHASLGTIALLQGKHDEAVQRFRQALSFRADDPETLANLGATLLFLGKSDEAESSLVRAVQLDPKQGSAHRQLGQIAMRGRKHEEALVHFRRALEANPEDAELHNDLGIVSARLRRYEDAEAHYRHALRLRPAFPDAHNNLGNTLRNRGRHDEAVAAFREALRLRPNYPEALNNMGIALRSQGKLDEAINSYQRALSLRPSYAEAHNNLGFALSNRGKFEPAILCYQQAVRLNPDYFEAHHNMANALAEMGRVDEAVGSYRNALRIRPNEARIHKCLGIMYSRQEKFDDAVTSFREALRLRPDFPDAHNDLGITLARKGRHKEAAEEYREALKFRPLYAEAHNNLGNSLRNTGQFDESLKCYQKALEIRPNYADAHNNYGIALAEMGNFDEAIACYTRCLELRPNHVDAHMNRALTWLRKGDYAQGWAEYEWRWRKRSLSNRPLIQPPWNGFPLKNRTILLITEQGFGDVLQFIRYAAILKEQGARVVFECPEKLLKLMSGCTAIDQVVPQGHPLPHYDVYSPLLTVPGLVGTSLETIPRQVPYLHADSTLVAKWQREFDGVRELKVGINWQGNPKYAGDFHRSIPLLHFEALARVPGVRLYSLQKYDGVEQLLQVAGRFPVTDLGSRLDNSTGPFLDTAAVLDCLDLFISSDTAVVHLAGALGVPVWMPLSTTPDWRWLTGREDNPWYPTMRVFRQSRYMSWEPVFERMAAELRKLVPATIPTRSVIVETAPGELIDKITILEIKAGRITDPVKRVHVQSELAKLLAARDRTVVASPDLDRLTGELRKVNETLWQVEDDLRVCERNAEFGPQFVELARSVYRSNDHRARIKKQINILLNSDIVEEKSYV